MMQIKARSLQVGGKCKYDSYYELQQIPWKKVFKCFSRFLGKGMFLDVVVESLEKEWF